MTMIFRPGELSPNAPHLFADLTELLALVRYSGRDKIHKNDILALHGRASTSLDEIDNEERELTAANSDAARNDRLERQVENVWIQLAYRERAFQATYPFVVRGDELIIQTNLTIQQRAYRLLLACSRLRSFNGTGVAQRWAKAFASLCRHAMCGLVPRHASVRIFDANSVDRQNYYGSDLRSALCKLGQQLRVHKVFEDECNKQSSSGDAGLDLVAVIDFDDGAASTFAVMGQCGAQEKNWPAKTLEAHPVKFRSFFSVLYDWPAVMFTPVCYRTATGEWVDNQSATGVLVADRGRILSLLNMANAWDEVSASTWLETFEAEFAQATPD